MTKGVYLTVMELRLLTFLATGYQPKQIYKMVNLSYPTVKFYIRIIKAKLGADTTTQAVAIAVANRQVSPFSME